MTAWGKRVLSVLLWFFGGTLYFLLEIAWKMCHNEPEKISWTMLVLAIFLTIPVERFGEQLSWDCPLWLQAAACAALVTAAELYAGLLLNNVLGLNVWDYSDLPGNLWGQICPQFSFAWWVLCLAFIPIFDWMRYAVEGGERPKYKII